MLKVLGGIGFSEYSKLGQLTKDYDVNLTWEGDNWVLLQQTARYILTAYQGLAKQKPLPNVRSQLLNIP
jgi:acyl-CoA oxidase